MHISYKFCPQIEKQNVMEFDIGQHCFCINQHNCFVVARFLSIYFL